MEVNEMCQYFCHKVRVVERLSALCTRTHEGVITGITGEAIMVYSESGGHSSSVTVYIPRIEYIESLEKDEPSEIYKNFCGTEE